MAFDQAITDLWYQALHNPPGIAVKTDDRQLLRQQLYKARLAAVDDSLSQLSLVFAHTGDEVCIVHKRGPGDATEQG